MNFEDLLNKNISNEWIKVPADGGKETTMIAIIWTNIVFTWQSNAIKVKENFEIKTEREDYEKMYKMVKSMGDRFPAKALAVMKITEVYECKSGAGAGKQLLWSLSE